MRPLFALLAACVAAGTALGVSAAAASPWQPERSLLVQPSGDAYPQLDLSFEFGADAPPGRISLFVPSGVSIYPRRPPGSPVGALLVTAAQAGPSPSVSQLYGDVGAAALDAATEAAADACNPGEHLAVWRASLSLLGQPLELPIYIARPASADPLGTTLRLDLCLPPLAPAAPVLPALSLRLSLFDLVPPAGRGSYSWRALVTPLAPDRMSLLPERTYELRSLNPVPHRLTLSARYLAKERAALLQGRLSANGEPRAKVDVVVVRLVRRVTPRGVVFSDAVAGVVRTGKLGNYRLRVKMPRTAGFFAFAPATTQSCPGTSPAPAGCPSMTVSGAESETLTVHVPG